MKHPNLVAHVVKKFKQRLKQLGGSTVTAPAPAPGPILIDDDSDDVTASHAPVPSVVWDALVPPRTISVHQFLERSAARPSCTTNIHSSASPSPHLPTHLTDLSGRSFHDTISFLRSSPLPSHSNLTTLRTDLSHQSPLEWRSVCLSFGTRTAHLPLWIEKCLTQVEALEGHASRWRLVDQWLEMRLSIGGPTRADTSLACQARLHQMSWDVAVPGLSDSHLSTSGFTSLLSNSWLDDELINAGGEWINKRLGPASPIRVLNTHFLASLSQHRTRHHTWSPSRPRVLDTLVSTKAVNFLLVPIHLPGHWTYLALHVVDRSCVYIDSADPDDLFAPSSALDLLDWWLDSVMLESGEISEDDGPGFEVDRQTDGHSCGVAVLSTMAHVALGYAPWEQVSSDVERMQWYLRLSAAFGPASLQDLSPLPPPPPPFPPSVMHVFDVDPDELNNADFDPFIFQRSSRVKRSHPTPIHLHPRHSTSLPVVNTIHSTRITASTPLSLAVQKTVQSTLTFPKLSRDVWLAQQAVRARQTEVERVEDRERAMLERDRQKADERLHATNRKAVYRKRKWEDDIAAGIRDQKGKKKKPLKLLRLSDDSPAASPIDAAAAELSRPRRDFKELQRAKKGPAGRRRHRHASNAVRMNWTQPFIWAQIEAEAKAVGYPWSATEITKRLKRRDPITFATFRNQRISDWRIISITDRLVWRPNVVAAVAHGNRPHGITTRQHIFTLYPVLVNAIKSQLTKMRAAGLPLELTTIRGIMVALIHHHAPDLFVKANSRGVVFRCSEVFVRRFLKQSMKWSIRHATRAAQKIPNDVDRILFRAFLRMACLVRNEDVPAAFIVNADQTQVVFAQGANMTWTESGQKQVAVVGQEEKRAMTLMVAISPGGAVLPVQAVYQGKDPTRSLPKSTVPGYDEAMALGFLFTVSGTSTYWSTQATMRIYVTQILVPYFIKQRTLFKRPHQVCVFQIDCWSVHRSAEFRGWMQKTYPWIVLQYVPGGCTGLFQACDTGTQKPFKAAIKRASHADLVEETLGLLAGGADASTIVLDKTVGTLRNRSVRWLVAGFHAINKPDLVMKAFRICAAGDFNLSHASLTSTEALAELASLRVSDPEFYAEISSGATERFDRQVDFHEDVLPSLAEVAEAEAAEIFGESDDEAGDADDADYDVLDGDGGEDPSVDSGVTGSGQVFDSVVHTDALTVIRRSGRTKHVAGRWWKLTEENSDNKDV